MKKIISIFLALLMVLTVIQFPSNVSAKSVTPLDSAIDSDEELNITLSTEWLRDNDYLTLMVTSREDYQLAKANDAGTAQVTFQDVETKQTYTQELNYHADENLNYQVSIFGNVDKLGFGENRPITISAIEINQKSYTHFNNVSLTYSDRIIPNIISVKPDDNNQEVYTEKGEYSFVITTDQKYSIYPSARLKVQDEQNHTRTVYTTSEQLSDMQYRITFQINEDTAIKGKYTLNELYFGDLYINENSELYQSLELSQISFRVEFGNDDFFAPEFVSVQSNIENNSTITGKKEIVYTFELKNDEDIDLEQSHIYFSQNGSSESVSLKKVKDHLYTITLLCDETIPSGVYRIDMLRLADLAGNVNEYNSEKLGDLVFHIDNSNEGSKEQLSIVSMTRIPDDVVYLNKDHSQLQFQITFNKSVSYSYLRYQNENKELIIVGDIKDNVVTYTINYDEKMKTGNYSLNHIYATTGFANFNEYNNYGKYQLGFQVTSDSEAYLKTLSFTQNNEKVKPNSKLDFQLEFSQVVNNVTLNFVNKDHLEIRINIKEDDFQSTSGSIEGFINEKYGNGTYVLDDISYYSNGSHYWLDSNSGIWHGLHFDQIQFEIVDSHDDFVKPTITNVTLDETMDTHLTSQNDQYSFLITTSKSIDTTTSHFFFSNSDGYLLTGIELVDDSQHQYRVFFSLNNDSYDGVYTLNNLTIQDEHGNQSHYYKGNENKEIQKLFNLQLTVSAGIEKLQCVLSNFQYDINEIYSKNGKVNITFNTDKEVDNISFQFTNITYNKNEFISAKVIDTKNNKWMIEFDINDTLLNGQYKLQSINIYKNNGAFYNIYQEMSGYEDLFKQSQFYIECGHPYQKAPRIRKLIADQKNATHYDQNGTAIFYLTTSSEIDVQKTSLDFGLEGYSDKYVTVQYKIDKISALEYKITCQVNQKLFNGHYYIRSLDLVAQYGNNTYYGIYDDARGYYYLSGLGFDVSCGISDLDAPQLLKVYASSQNKDVYKENGEYTYYFQFNEDIDVNASGLTFAGDDEFEPWKEFVSLGNHLYAVKFYVNKKQIKNGHYQFSYINVSDIYGNYLNYSINDRNNSSALDMFYNEFLSFEFTVQLPEIKPEEPKIISIIPYQNTIFNESGDQDIFKLIVDRELTNTNVLFVDENDHYISAYASSVQKTPDGYEYIFSVYVSSANYEGVYKLHELNISDEDHIYSIDLSNYPHIQFTNNVEHKTLSIDNIVSIDFKDDMKFNNKDEQAFMDITLIEKMENYDLVCHWENIKDKNERMSYPELINMEEKDGQYIYHYGLSLYDLDGLSQYQLKDIMFNQYREDTLVIDQNTKQWEDFKLDSVQLETLFDDNNDEMNFKVTSLSTNQSIYTKPGVYSYIIESEKNFVLTDVNVSSYQTNIYLSNVEIQKLSNQKYQINIPITADMKNDIYNLQSFNYTMDEQYGDYYCGNGVNYFEINCGLEDYETLELVNVSEITNEEKYIASESKEISFVAEFNKAIQDLEAYFMGYSDEQLYCMDIKKITEKKYKVSMIVDETFQTGDYDFLYLKGTDGIGQVQFFDLQEYSLKFNVDNKLDQNSSDLKIDIVSQKTESEEIVERNAWTNESVELNINVHSSDESPIKYLVSEDGKAYKEFDEKAIAESGEHKLYIKAIDESENESNVVVVKVKVDKDKPYSQIIDISPKLRSVIQKVGRKITIDAEDKMSGVKSVEYKLVPKNQNEDAYPYIIGTSVTIPANFEGKLYVRVTDNAGNVDIDSYDFDKLAKLDINLTGKTNTTITDDQLSINVDVDDNDTIQYVGIKYNGNEYEDITDSYNKGVKITKNGTYTIYVQTYKGAEDEAKITYNNIDANPVDFKLIGNTENTTVSDWLEIAFKNPDIVKKVTIQKDNDTPEDITSTYQQKQKIVENGTYKVRITTTSDQELEKTITYQNIYIPDMSLSFDIEANNHEEYLSEDIITFVISPKNTVVSSLKVYKDNELLGDIKDSYQNGYNVTENGQYKFELTTNDGQTKVKEVTYTNIDKTQPTIVLTGQTNSQAMKDLLNIEVKADQSGISLVKIQKDNGDEENITESYTKGYSIEANGTYKVIAVMKSGKTVSSEITYAQLTEAYIHLNKTSVQLKPEETYQLNVSTNIENPQFVFESTNDNVASVDSRGIITALKNGETTIIVQCQGYKVKVNCVVTVSDMTYQLGDMNRDGKITVLDAQILLKYCVDGTQLDAEQLKLADLNQDGEVTVLDAQFLLKLCVE